MDSRERLAMIEAEIQRLEEKIKEADDEDIKSALKLKIASLKLELGSAAADLPLKTKKVVKAPTLMLSEPEPEVVRPVAPDWTPEEREAREKELYRLQVKYDEATDEDVRDTLDVAIQRIFRELEGYSLAHEEEEIPTKESTASPKQIADAENLP